MIRFSATLRNLNPRHLTLCIQQQFATNSSSSSSSNTSSSSDDENVAKTKPDVKGLDAKSKLSMLLEQMIKDDNAINTKSKLNLAKPSPKRKEIRTEKGVQSVKIEPVEKQVITAVKNVAQTIGGDVKQTESELLSKLLNPIKDEPVAQAPVGNLSDIIKGMKIDRESTGSEEVSRAQQVRQLLHRVRPGQQHSDQSPAGTKAPRRTTGYSDRRAKDIQYEKTDLFGSERLGIFTSAGDTEPVHEDEDNKTWKMLHARELRLAVTHPPSNYFQQQILWTEQGKLWKFPIDNEQGMEEEQNIYFAEHVFLEKHLEPWCPPKGPIRHFMELVCVGLSKNPYLSVQHKKEHIDWFKNYFNEKKQLLQEVGAMSSDTNISKTEPKSVNP